MTKTHILFCIAFLWQIALHAQEGVAVDEKYQGYRLFITNVQLVKSKASYKRIQYDVVNTGRKKIQISSSKQIPKEWIQLKFDQTWTDLKFNPYIAQFKTALIAQGIKLEVGQMARAQELKFSTAPEVVTTVAQKEKKPEIVVELIDEQKILTEKEPVESEAAEVKEIEPAKVENKKEVADSKPEPKQEDTLDLPKIPVVAIATSTESCADLIFEKVEMLKQSKRYATIQFTIKNIGDGPALMLGETDKLSDNIAIRAYISGIPQLTRGALVLGGMFINEGFTEEKQTLAPNQKHTAQIRLDITKRTRYMNNLILSLDDYYTIQECDKTNNVFILQL